MRTSRLGKKNEKKNVINLKKYRTKDVQEPEEMAKNRHTFRDEEKERQRAIQRKENVRKRGEYERDTENEIEREHRLTDKADCLRGKRMEGTNLEEVGKRQN